MGFTEILTIIFIVLKVLDLVSWSWWIVFLPEIIAVVLYVIGFLIGLLGVGKTAKRMDKHFRDFDF